MSMQPLLAPLFTCSSSWESSCSFSLPYSPTCADTGKRAGKQLLTTAQTTLSTTLCTPGRKGRRMPLPCKHMLHHNTAQVLCQQCRLNNLLRPLLSCGQIVPASLPDG